MKATVAVMYGMGGAFAEYWSTGERLLVKRLNNIGVDTGESPYSDKDRQKIHELLRLATGFIGIVGDSLGACNAPLYAADLLPKPVDYIAGFQPSIYGQHVPITDNVHRAHCIYDPDFLDTQGLGALKWELAVGNNKTKLLVTEHRGAHPDDWGYSQDIVFNEISGMLV